MPGSLAHHLRQALAATVPRGWQATPEAPMFDRPLAERLGFDPRCDLLLHHRASDRRLWIEFEISRADPVANHMKVAVGHLHQPLGRGDCFVSMCSRHIAAGRRALAREATAVLRQLSIHAVQLDLLPTFDGKAIARLNHRLPAELATLDLPIAAEWQRIVDCTTTAAAGTHGELRLAPTTHLATATIARWARDILTRDGRRSWGRRRRCRYWALDPASGAVAPCKVAAYTIEQPGRSAPGPLDLATYDRIEYEHPLFDGTKAWQHLHRGLGFREGGAEERSHVATWLQRHDLTDLTSPGPCRVFLPLRLGDRGAAYGA